MEEWLVVYYVWTSSRRISGTSRTQYYNKWILETWLERIFWKQPTIFKLIKFGISKYQSNCLDIILSNITRRGYSKQSPWELIDDRLGRSKTHHSFIAYLYCAILANMIRFLSPLQEQTRQVRYNSILVDLFSLLVFGIQDYLQLLSTTIQKMYCHPILQIADLEDLINHHSVKITQIPRITNELR